MRSRASIPTGVPGDRGATRPRLFVSAATFAPETPLPERLEAAAAAGLAGVGVSPQDVERCLAQGIGPEALRHRIDALGLETVELQVLRDWGARTQERASRTFEERVYAAAGVVGGRYVVAVGEVDDDAAFVAGRFRALCERAAAAGLRVALEFVPWTTIPDLRRASEIVERAGHENGGVLVDAWHHLVGGGRPDDLAALPARRIVALHLCDAPAGRAGTLVEEARHRRLLPGEGVLDLEGLLRHLGGRGVACPLSLEIPSDRLRALPAAEIAALAARAGLDLLDRVRPTGA